MRRISRYERFPQLQQALTAKQENRMRINMLLLTNCEVLTGKYSDRSLDVRTERSEVRIFSRMARTNWSIRALLYSRNQH